MQGHERETKSLCSPFIPQEPHCATLPSRRSPCFQFAPAHGLHPVRAGGAALEKSVVLSSVCSQSPQGCPLATVPAERDVLVTPVYMSLDSIQSQFPIALSDLQRDKCFPNIYRNKKCQQDDFSTILFK